MDSSFEFSEKYFTYFSYFDNYSGHQLNATTEQPGDRPLLLDQTERHETADYSIADIAAYPWIHRLEREASHLDGFRNLTRWHGVISERPAAVKRAYRRSDAINTVPTFTKESRKVLLGV